MKLLVREIPIKWFDWYNFNDDTILKTRNNLEYYYLPYDTKWINELFDYKSFNKSEKAFFVEIPFSDKRLDDALMILIAKIKMEGKVGVIRTRPTMNFDSPYLFVFELFDDAFKFTLAANLDR